MCPATSMNRLWEQLPIFKQQWCWYTILLGSHNQVEGCISLSQTVGGVGTGITEVTLTECLGWGWDKKEKDSSGTWRQDCRSGDLKDLHWPSACHHSTSAPKFTPSLYLWSLYCLSVATAFSQSVLHSHLIHSNFFTDAFPLYYLLHILCPKGQTYTWAIDGVNSLVPAVTDVYELSDFHHL